MQRDGRHGWVAALTLVLAAACSRQSSNTPPALSDAGLTPDPGESARACVDAAPPPDMPVLALDVQGCRHAPDAGVELAVFNWVNRTGQIQSAPYGPLNQMSPGQAAQGQGESFAIGDSGQFIVPMTGSPVTWSLLGRSLRVSANSADCGESCLSNQLAGPDSFEVDTCTKACGDGSCDPGESCRGCPADCDCSALEPLLDCVSLDADGTHHVSFGYRNSAASGAGIALGPDNRLAPGADGQSQPVFFKPGEHHDVFNVTYSNLEPTWTLGGSSVTATADAPPCAQTCASCPQGTVCVGDNCVATCGDGQCDGHENCLSCVADCGCGDGVCFHGGCASLGRCGIEAECGAFDSFHAHVDCGPCADGLACVSNLCRPLCSAVPVAPRP